MAKLNFNAREVKPNSFDPLPANWYVAIISASETKPTKNGQGSYLQLTLDIVDGEYKGRKLFDRLNLINNNSQAVEIARGTLSAICHAVGVLEPQDSVELHNVPLQVKVIVKKNAETGEMQNEVKGYKPKDGTPSSAAAGAKPAAGKPAAAAAGKGRWTPNRVKPATAATPPVKPAETAVPVGTNGSEHDDDEGATSGDDVPPFE